MRFARDCDLRVAVRGGGHDVAGPAVCDDGIVIDLSAIRAPSASIVDRRPSSSWCAVGRAGPETQAHGLATTGGIVTHTGLTGLTLGGGIGWLMRKHGLTADNLIDAEVVTATGDICGRRRTNAPTSSGRCAAAAGTSAWSPRSGSTLHPVGPTARRCSGRPRTRPTSCASTGLRRRRARRAHDRRSVAAGPAVAGRRRRPPSRLPAATVEDGSCIRALRSSELPLVDLVRPALYVDHQRGIDDTVRMAGTTTGKARTSPPCPTQSSTSLPDTPTAPPPRGRTRRSHMGGAVARAPPRRRRLPGSAM